MFYTEPVFVGVDPASSKRSFSYAALDRNLNLVSLADGGLDEVTAFLAGQQSATVAVNAPSSLNRGLVRARLKKEMLTPHKTRTGEYRLAEYELRGHGITVTGTPSSVAACPAWIQTGFSLYRKLTKMDFLEFPADGPPRQWLETHPYACYCVLAGCVPLPKATLEGKIQRQLLLFERGVRIKDPMEIFEEITRYKMLHGVWPHELLYLPGQLDAIVAAYTAWLAATKPDEVSFVGDSNEGKVFLPAKNLKEKY